MLKVNGAEFNPAPSSYTVAVQDISKADRNTLGTMIIERIATKRKLSLSWEGVLSESQVSTILTAISDVFFTVEYIDPQTGTTKTGTFYSGDRTVEGVVYKDSIMYWKGLKFDLIER